MRLTFEHPNLPFCELEPQLSWLLEHLPFLLQDQTTRSTSLSSLTTCLKRLVSKTVKEVAAVYTAIEGMSHLSPESDSTLGGQSLSWHPYRRQVQQQRRVESPVLPLLQRIGIIPRLVCPVDLGRFSACTLHIL